MIHLHFRNKENSLSKELGDELASLMKYKFQLRDWQILSKDSLKPTSSLYADDNYILKGDNLPLLYSLAHIYEGAIKLIYIDPPYNTGKTFFGYKDSMSHEDWLIFMKNRLEAAKTLMHEEGTIWISIDSKEMAYLKVLCDEIFGRNNFVGEIIWETASDNNARQISNQHEYVLCYAREKSNLKQWKVTSEKASIIIERYEAIKSDDPDIDPRKIQQKLRAWINGMRKSKEVDLTGVSHYNYVDDIGVYYPGNSANTRAGGYDLNLTHPTTGKICKKPANGYRWPETTFWAADERGDVLWPKDENGIPKIKKRIETATELLKGYYYEDNRRSTKALTNMLGEKKFHNPKSINLLSKIIRFASDADDLVLDFFGGSGSTAHAILQVNQEDQAARKFILIEKMDFVENVMLPRMQKVMGNERIIFAKLQVDRHNEPIPYINEKDSVADQFYDQ